MEFRDVECPDCGHPEGSVYEGKNIYWWWCNECQEKKEVPKDEVDMV